MGRFLWPVVAALLLVAGSAWAADDARSAASLTAGMQRVTLKNGLRLVLAPDAQATAVDFAVWYDAGSRHDRPGKSGLAHLFEHLMFRGSKQFGPDEHSRLVRAEGGTSGAFASSDLICFYENLPPDALELGFRLEADRMTGLTITQASLDAERRNVAGERARRATLMSRGLERLYAMAYASHPYRRSIYGESADLAKLTLTDVQEFYRRHFGPSNAVVTIVGRFEPDQALAFAKKHFEPLRPTGGRAGAPPPMEKPQTSERRATETVGTQTRALMASWRLPPRSDPRWPAIDLLAFILGRGNSSRLYRALVVDRSLSASVQGDLERHKDESLFYVSAPILQNADTAEVEKRLFGEIGRLTFEPVSEQELEKAKRQVETATWMGLQTSRGRSQVIGHSVMLAGDEQDFARHLEKIRAVTANDVMKAATLLDPAARQVLWIVPGPTAGGRP